jgi:Flp pilus assembly protein TadG
MVSVRKKTVQRKIRHGAVTVEFAFSALLTFTFVFGLIEFSRILMLQNSAQNAAYEAARAAIVPGGTAQKSRDAAAIILEAVGATGATTTVSPSTITDSVKEVTVTIEIPMDQNLWITPVFTSGLQLSQSCELARERTTFSSGS